MRNLRQALLPAPLPLPGLQAGGQDRPAQVHRVRHGRHLHGDPHGGRAVLDAHPVRACDRETRRGPADHDPDCLRPVCDKDRDAGEKRVPQDRHRWRERHHPLRHEVRAGGMRSFFTQDFFRSLADCFR